MCARKASAAVVLTCILCTVAIAGQLPDLKRNWIFPAVHVRSDGLVYILGSYDPDDGYLLELYDPTAGSTDLPQRPPVSTSGRKGTTSQVLFGGNRLLVCLYDNCQVYSPSSNAWEGKRVQGGDTNLLVMNDGQILRAGGMGYYLDTSESYLIDPATLQSVATGRLNESRDGHAMVKLSDGRVLAAGGLHWFMVGAGPVRSAEIFDPTTRIWTKVAGPRNWLGGKGWLLPDGTAFVLDIDDAEVYDSDKDEWTVVPFARGELRGQTTFLPNGTVLFSGGNDVLGSVKNVTTIYDPLTGATRPGRPMRIPRTVHGAALLPDGGVLALGGLTTAGVATKSVEQIYYGESQLTASLDPGFYVVSTTQDQWSTDGLWGVDVQNVSGFEGGWHFGGLLPAAGKDVGFASFSLAAPATVNANVILQALPATNGPLEFTLQLLDSNKRLVAGPISGLGSLQWTQTLQPGSYIVELRSSSRAPAAAFQVSLLAPHLAPGASGGAVLDRSAGVAGFVGFYLASRQDVQIKLYNENTYGRPRGVGEVTLTLYDAAGRRLQAVGPDAP